MRHSVTFARPKKRTSYLNLPLRILLRRPFMRACNTLSPSLQGYVSSYYGKNNERTSITRYARGWQARLGWRRDHSFGRCRLLFKTRLFLKKSTLFLKKTTLLLKRRLTPLLQRPSGGVVQSALPDERACPDNIINRTKLFFNHHLFGSTSFSCVRRRLANVRRHHTARGLHPSAQPSYSIIYACSGVRQLRASDLQQPMPCRPHCLRTS